MLHFRFELAYNEYAINEAKQIKNSEAYMTVAPILNIDNKSTALFPHPKEAWIDAVYDCAGQWDAYKYLSPIAGKRIVQLGGKGSHAVKFLLAGASEAIAISPMLGEAACARALSEEFGVADRLFCVVAVAEELPIADGMIDSFYLGGCLHHMQTEFALPEVKRVLSTGGRFAAVEPWRAPLYTLGTRILGKREANAYCKPLTAERLEPVKQIFADFQVVQHGTLTRYPLLALNKFGINSSLAVAWQANQVDDAISSLIPGMRGMGSSVVILCEK
jgi:SAM-dependent methyltransferase